MKNQPGSKKGRILRHMQHGNIMTPMKALRNYGVFRLAVTINRLRNEGYNIETTMMTEGESTFASYKLES